MTRPMLLLTTFLAMAAPAAVFAQSAEPADDAGEGVGGVADIVVTANRRAENLQDVPISIAAFEGETLKTLGVQSVVDLPQITPGLSFTRTLVGTNAFLRGVGTTTAGYSTEVPIATYIDGLYLPNSAASSFSFNNIERIEVLKGPQGTLYGRNTTGGLIHVITKEPGRDREIDMSVSYASYNTVQANFYGSTPITDTLAVNFAALYIDQGDGWGTNAFLGTEGYTFKDHGFQGKIRWEPGEDTRITLRGFYDKIETDQGNAGAIYPGSVGVDGTPYLGEYVFASRYPTFADQRQYSISLKVEHDFSFATLSSLTGYINNESNGLQSQNGIPGNPVPGQGSINLGGVQTAETWSQELQLTSRDDGGPLSWIVGAFFYDDNTWIRATVFGTCVGTVCAPPVPNLTSGNQKTRSWSGYVDGTYSLTPSTRLTLGFRYTSDRKTLDGTLVPVPGFPNSIPAFPPGTVTSPGMPFPGFPNGIDTDVTYNKPTWRIVLAQDLSDDINVYASYNRGFKSGGFNPTSFTNPPSLPEELDAFEIGLKSDLFDRLLRLNVAAFYYDYRDIQMRTTAPPAPPGSSLLINAASAEIKGIDADFVLAPAPGLIINGALQLLDARYKSFPAAICTTPRPIGGPVLGGTTSATCDASGNRLPSAPEFSYSLGITYSFDTSIGGFELNANDGYKADYYWEPDNRLKQNSFHVLNASVTWKDASDTVSVQLFGRNLGGAYYFSSAANGGGNDVYIPAAPRTYGVKLRYRL